jgi:hypothetical protein
MKSIDTRRALGLILVGTGLLFAIIYLAGQLNRSASNVPIAPTNFGPLVPTPIGKAPPLVPYDLVEAEGTAIAAALLGSARPSATEQVAQAPYARQERVCVGVPFVNGAAKPLSELRPGWYLDWSRTKSPEEPGGAEYAQMVRVPRGQIVPDLKSIAQIAQENPSALWLIGNEMDVIWQDNATPKQYAAAYHDVYTTLKQSDPTSRVAIGGVSEPSPLRLQYLDEVLRAYRERYGQDMPIDVWNVHNFILPEERGSWGVDIPPGLDATRGLTYTIEDHDNLDYFKQQLFDFRRWMEQRGFGDKELIVSEYGILMYEDYGFDYERVRDFMLGSFDVMLNTTDAELGLPADGHRLVQRWCWYSLNDVNYPTNNLADAATGELTPLGRDFKRYQEASPP